MRRRGAKISVLRIGVGACIATAFLLALVLVFPGARVTLTGVYVLVLGAFAAAAFVGSIRELGPKPWERSPFERRRELPEDALPVDELQRIDRLVVLGCANAFDLHYRLRPLLRELTAHQLRATHGADLDADPDRAAALLGGELWSVVRPDRELGRRRGPGLAPDELRRIVDRLETL